MYVSLWIILFSSQCLSYCYENLSRKPTTTLSQSSTYSNYYATRANDGLTTTSGDYCANTAPNHPLAWFQVDLGKFYNIWNVKIYYRKEDDWKQYRFREFYIDVSNSSVMQTATPQRTRCYTDYTIYPDLPPNIIDIPCQQTARYVIVETTYDAPEDKATRGAILEICEIEVYGCGTTCKENVCDGSRKCVHGCIDGYWGPACDSKCPANCKEPSCVRTMGYCHSCKSGYLGVACTSQCPMYCIEGVCDKIEGSCIEGCTTGQYGNTCNNTCSSGCEGGTCDQQSGNCTAGCLQNWTGLQCDVKQSQVPNKENSSSLYVVIAVLCISLVVNICTITWILKNNVFKRRNESQKNTKDKSNSDFVSTPGIYDTAVDNDRYQELGQLSGPSHYDQLKGPTNN